jgi:23S rRNA pseudouridine2605 synthase
MFQAENKLPVLTAYLSRSGVASRRAVVPFIQDGFVTVNNLVMTDPSYRVKASDEVTFKGAPVTTPKHPIYILLNKPNGYITTTSDDKGRRTVMDFFVGSDLPRLYPVGRLDRKTTGLLLFTNDGDCAYRLSHPKFEVEKRYAVTLDRPLSKEHFEQIKKGTMLFDGLASVDSITYEKSFNVLSVTVHNGKNRIIRRIFEEYGYDVISLDRFSFAGFKKQGLSVGRWRYLDHHEIARLLSH